MSMLTVYEITGTKQKTLWLLSQFSKFIFLHLLKYNLHVRCSATFLVILLTNFTPAERIKKYLKVRTGQIFKTKYNCTLHFFLISSISGCSSDANLSTVSFASVIRISFAIRSCKKRIGNQSTDFFRFLFQKEKHLTMSYVTS